MQDALHHSSLVLICSLALDYAEMAVNVTIAAMCPDCIDARVFAAMRPLGLVNVSVVRGGMDVTDPENGLFSVTANAAVEARSAISPDMLCLS